MDARWQNYVNHRASNNLAINRDRYPRDERFQFAFHSDFIFNFKGNVLIIDANVDFIRRERLIKANRKFFKI